MPDYYVRLILDFKYGELDDKARSRAVRPVPRRSWRLGSVCSRPARCASLN